MVVGKGRSGTAIIQRIITDISGIHSPPETHFGQRHLKGLLHRHHGPLDAEAIREEIRLYASHRDRIKHPVDYGSDFRYLVHDLLEGHCESPIDFFAALVQAQTGWRPDTDETRLTYGEKTPSHIRWIRPFGRAMPDVQFIALVRDPRDVFASAKVAWGHQDSLRSADWWCIDYETMARARHEFGDRVHIFKYEDVVTHPQWFQRYCAGLLNVPYVLKPLNSAHEILPPGDRAHTKVHQPVDGSSIGKFREVLSPREIEVITTRCRAYMELFGYDTSAAKAHDGFGEGVWSAAEERARLIARTHRLSELAVNESFDLSRISQPFDQNALECKLDGGGIAFA